MRSRKKPWADRELAANELLIRSPRLYKGKWRGYFGNSSPIHLEIGCGKGGFITKTALRGPSVNYIALEREEQIIASAMRLSKGVGLKNIGFILSDASFLPHYFGAGEIERLYINFCDPWRTKKKWEKRRLTHGNFLDIYRGFMSSGSAVFFKTDNKDLFEFSVKSFGDKGWRLENICFDLGDSEDNIKTEYEEKFSAIGVPIYRLEAYNE